MADADEMEATMAAEPLDEVASAAWAKATAKELGGLLVMSESGFKHVVKLGPSEYQIQYKEKSRFVPVTKVLPEKYCSGEAAALAVLLYEKAQQK